MIEIHIEKKLRAASGTMNLKVDLTIEKGQFITLYGVSGAGKTSVLRMLAGLLSPDKGQIRVHNTTWFDHDKKASLPPQKRNIGFVFQDYALFPHLTVRQNLEFARRADHNASVIEELITLTELENLQHEYPENLSGGQKQRVALARALVQQPEILLLDEPLSALDPKIRVKLQKHLKEAHQKFGLTTILVSHDIGEIHRLSDRVVHLDNGAIINDNTPLKVFSHHQVSGKFQFTGEILHIQKQEVVCLVSVLINHDIVRVIAQADEIATLEPGDKVIVASKAFNPVIMKI